MAVVIDLKSRRVLAPPPPNPFAVALASLAGAASLQAAMYGQAAAHWAAIAALYRAQSYDDTRPSDVGDPEDAA